MKNLGPDKYCNICFLNNSPALLEEKRIIHSYIDAYKPPLYIPTIVILYYYNK